MRIALPRTVSLVVGCTAAAVATTVALVHGGGDLAVALMVSVVVGAYLIARVPGNAVGPTLMVFGYAGVLSDLAEGLLGRWQVVGFPGPVTAKSVAVLGASIFPLVGAMGTTLMLIFPTGSARNRWRWVLRGVVAAGVVGVIAGFVWAVFEPLDTVVADVLANSGTNANPAGTAAAIVFVPGMPLSLFALGLRYRTAVPTERLQIRWVALAAAVVLVLGIAVNVIDRFDGLLGLLSTISLGLLPLAVAVAVTRYRLYEIDRIVSRVVTYAVVAVALAGVFALLAVLPGVVVGSADVPPWLVAVSTLIAFALFNPLRRRVQRAVDRRFARLPYEPEAVLGEIRQRVQDEVDVSELADSLHSVAKRALGPTQAAVWVREPV